MKITILTFDCPNFIGGPNSWLRRILPVLRDKGLDISVLFFIAGKPEYSPCFQFLVSEKFCCKSFPRSHTTEQKILWLLSELKTSPPDIFLVCLQLPGFYACRWITAAKIPTIGMIHADNAYFDELCYQFAYGEPEYQLSTLVCVSEYLQEKLILLNPRLRNTRTQIQYIPYGVTIPKCIADPPQDALRVIYAGRLVEEQKRISETTRALCRVAKEVQGVEVIIYGDGAAKNNVSQILDEHGKDLPIRMGGVIDQADIYDVMAQAHVFVLLSDYEGLPVALLEAMACGLVPVTTKIDSGNMQLIEDQVTGILVDDRSDSFVDAIKSLVDNKEKWINLSIAARQKVMSLYSIDYVAEQWVSLFDDLIANNHQKKKSIKIPIFFNLPSTPKAFESKDFREPSLFSQLKGMIKRQLSNGI